MAKVIVDDQEIGQPKQPRIMRWTVTLYCGDCNMRLGFIAVRNHDVVVCECGARYHLNGEILVSRVAPA